jgi:3-oxoacyl-[acyl-carrier protein] reductase
MNSGPSPAALGLSGRVALVVGSTNGLVPELCAVLAAAGARVVLAAGDGAAARALVAGLPGGPHAARSHDIGAPEAAVAAAVAFGGRLDILVTLAGEGGEAGLAQASDAAWDAAIGGSLRGRYMLCRAAGEAMKAMGGGGRIVVVAGDAGMASARGLAGVEDGGALTMARSFARDLGPHGIGANALVAGPGARAIDAARAAVFLASPWASYVAGHALVVGGAPMR